MTATVAVTQAGGEVVVVAAVAGKKILVRGFILTGAGTGAVSLINGSAGASLSGVLAMVGASEPNLAPYAPRGWFSTSPGVALYAVQTGVGSSSQGLVEYILAN